MQFCTDCIYTPPLVIDAISAPLKRNGINIQRKFLEPSAGIGSFIKSFMIGATQVTAL
jgi:hypothetical protein